MQTESDWVRIERDFEAPIEDMYYLTIAFINVLV